MKVAFALCIAVALFRIATGAVRFSDARCYDTPQACSTAELRKICSYSRWACRELGQNIDAASDPEHNHITGECDQKGPRKFCVSEEEAKKCHADKDLCNSIGYFHFQ